MYLTYYVHLDGMKEVVDCQNARSGGKKKASLPSFALKSPHKNFMCYLGTSSYTCATSSETVRVITCLVRWRTLNQNNDTKPATSALYVTSYY